MDSRRLLEPMLDLHCHILPATDDGPETLEESLEVARFCVADGITHIVATPHCHHLTHLLRADILPRVEALQNALDEAEIPLQIFPGSEIRTSDIALFRAEYEADVLCHLGDDAAYSLLEFAWQSDQYPPDAPTQMRWLLERGTQPIIAHPERHGFLVNERARLHALVEAGAWLQITVDSLLGTNGPIARDAGLEFLAQYPDCVIATDAHRMERCSGLSRGYEVVAGELGATRADDLMARADGVLKRLLSRA